MLLQVSAGIASRGSMDTGGRDWPAVSYGFQSSRQDLKYIPTEMRRKHRHLDSTKQA